MLQFLIFLAQSYSHLYQANGYVFGYNDTRINSWGGYENVWVHGFFFQDWYDSRLAIQSVDTTQQLITVASLPTYGFAVGRRFFYWNVIDELDEAGEYYIDNSTGILYFWPPALIASDFDARVSVLTQNLIQITDASNVTFKGTCLHVLFFLISEILSHIGFTVEATRASGIIVTGGVNLEISDCFFQFLGGDAVIISSGVGHLVQRSQFFGLGLGGVSIDAGNRDTLTPCNHMVFANHFFNYARWVFCYQPAVVASTCYFSMLLLPLSSYTIPFNTGGVGALIVNNQINNAPHNAILLGLGNNHQIYFNEIFDVCQLSNDVGAFYQGRDWTSRGTYISYNYFHNIIGMPPNDSFPSSPYLPPLLRICIWCKRDIFR